MAANNGGSDSTGRKNYYNISYGMLSTNAKEAPEGYEAISITDIKSRRSKNENVDLRRKFYDTENGKDYPLRIFYTDITGIIESVEKDVYDKGISLKVTLHDKDGDESILQTDFYGKVCADFLNRLLSVNPANEINFRPYSIPASAEINGRTIEYYNSGVSMKDAGVKTERFLKGENSGLPRTVQITNAKGEQETSRVEQINFLWEKVAAKFSIGSTTQEVAPSAKEPAKEPAKAQPVTTNDLPF